MASATMAAAGTRPAAKVTAAYLALMVVPLVLAATGAGPRQGAAQLALPAHIGGLALLVAAMMGRGARWEFAAAVAPLVAIPLLYAELPLLMAAFGPEFRDPLVQSWEAAVTGANPARELAAAMSSRMVSEPLHAAYFSYYAIIYAPLLYLYRRSRHEGFGEATAAVMLAFAACFTVFVLFPVQGPRYLWPAPPAVPDGVFRSLVLRVLEQGSSRGAAFPSSHMAVAVVQTWMAFRWKVPGASLILTATVMLGVGAVYGGFHYAIDMIAGAVLGMFVAAGFTLSRRTG